jgi:predicted MFS family arabinose efflux permease
MVAIPHSEAMAADADELARDRWYVLFLLTCVYAINIADRYVVSTLIEPIKATFHLSDAAVGLLTGTAMAIFYVAAGMPLGALADRTNRKRMIVVAVACWSALTMACGLATNFWQLFAARIGVGIGEAGGTPPSNAILTDKFPPRQRGFALSLYAVGASAGAALGSSLGGQLSDTHGWRSTLVIFGALGIPVALATLLTLREPRRGVLDAHAHSEPLGMAATFRFILTQRSLVHVLAGATLVTFWGWGLVWWTPAFLVRSHGLTVGESGAVLGAMHGVGGTMVTLATAWICAVLAPRHPRWQVWFVAVATVAPVVPSILAYAVPGLGMAKLMLWLFVPMTYLYIGPTMALCQNLVPPPMRAQVCALVVFTCNVANLVVAPTLIGALSDALAPHLSHSAEALRYVLIGCGFTGLWGAFHYFAAARTLAQDLVRSGAETA